MFLKTWALFQHELLFLCWGVMDVALLTPFALALMPWAPAWSPPTFFLGLLLVMLLAFNLARLLSGLRLAVNYQQVATAVALALLLFFSLRGLLHQPQSWLDARWIGEFFRNLGEPGNQLWAREVVLFVLVVLMWARGLQMANRVVTLDRIGLRLRVGGLLLAPLVIWTSTQLTAWGGTAFILLFFLAGLTAVALTRAEEISRQEIGASAALTPRWLATIVLAALLIVLVAGVLAIVASGQAGTAVLGLFAPLGQALWAMVLTAVAAISYLLTPFLTAAQWLGPHFAGVWQRAALALAAIMRQWRQAWTMDEMGLGEGAALPQAQQTGSELSLNGQALVILLAVAAILAVCLLLRRAYQSKVVAVRPSSYSHGSGWPDAGREGMMQKLFSRSGWWREWRTAVTIRRIYRAMMQLAAAAGYPKADAETPYEYMDALAALWRQHQAEVQLITRAYVKTRYGEFPETAVELDEIRRAWQRLQQARPGEIS